MKKYLLIAAVGLLTTAGVTATVLSGKNKKTNKEVSKKSDMKKQCSRYEKSACY
jgi:hypothetical protein